ncbi:MAG: type VI secretion system protein TssA [Gemmataceae bacterium]|nr:type VI secretion system protein TssA [Gemmataceae bacterium]
MASAPVLDFSALTQPIPGDAPEGRTVPLPVRQKLGAARKETEPHPDDPNLGEVPRKADWPGIVRTVEDLLTNTSKDLLLVAQLTEALTRLHGFAGVRDGLHLFYELVEQCWDRVHPMPEEGEGMDVRTGPFHWLSDADRGARFPNTVREVSMLRIDNQTYSWMDWKCSQEGKPLVDGRDPVPAADFDRALPLSPDVAEDLTQANDELTRLEQKLDALMGADAPGMMGLRQALEDCAQLMQTAVRRAGPTEMAGAAPPAAEAAAALAPNGTSLTASLAVGTGTIATRAEAYRQIEHIAAVLEQLEPHSPIPDLLRRAVALGRMPFRQLIRELIRDPNHLAELGREFGIRELGEGAPLAPPSG